MSADPVAHSASAPLLAGGALHSLLGTARLLAPDGLPRPSAALVLGAFAWAVAAALVLLDAIHGGHRTALAFFFEPSPYAHALAALPVLLGVERAASRRLATLLDSVRRNGLLDAAGAAAYDAAFERARRRSASRLVEPLLALAAVALVAWFALDPTAPADDWSRRAGPHGVHLTAAGAWMRGVVGATIVFLALRWLHRFVVWSMLLATIARLPLALVPTHPDRVGGLGVLALYPSVFSGLILGIGATIGAELLAGAARGGTSLNDVVVATLAWMLTVLLVFLGPLLPFVLPLRRLRERAIDEFGRLGAGSNRAFVAALADTERGGPEPNAEQMESLNAIYERVLAIQPLLVTRRELAELLIVALLPLVPAYVSFLTPAKLLDLMLGGFR